MRPLIRPLRLRPGDAIATISPCHGWAGDPRTAWKYRLGASRLEELGLRVVAAPNALRGSGFLSANPRARADDVMWAFEEPSVRAVIANMGGNDSLRVLPFIHPDSIRQNPKILIGYSDVMNLHLLCLKCDLSSLYGGNLLHPVADAEGWHPYSRRWFQRALFDASPLGRIEPAREWTPEPPEYVDPSRARRYLPNEGYSLVLGQGTVRGRLIGGHTGIADLAGSGIEPALEDYDDAILFLEDIPEFFTPECLFAFFDALGERGILRRLRGAVIGKMCSPDPFNRHADAIRRAIREKHGRELPVLYGLNFGHSSPIFPLPYGALAEICCEEASFTILDSAVV